MAAVGFTLLLAACGSDSGAAESFGDVPDSLLKDAPIAPDSAVPAGSEMDKIRKRGYLIVGNATNNASFSLLNPMTNKVSGFDVDMTAMLSKYILGRVAVKQVLENSATREPLLNNGSVDVVIATYTVTPQRAERVTFAGPYFMSGSAILAKKNDDSIKTVDDLNGKKICAELNSTNALSVKQHAPRAQLVMLDAHAACLQAVREGRADGFANDEGSEYGDVQRYTSEFKVAIPSYEAAPYGIGVKQGSIEFAQFIDHWIELIEKDGHWAKAYQDTLGKKIPGGTPQPPKIGSVPGTS